MVFRKNLGTLPKNVPSSQKSGLVPERFQKILIVSKKIVYEETIRKIHILIHKSYTLTANLKRVNL
jgi:hypothetical protein